MHDKTSSWENANFKMYPSPQKLNYLQKKVTPPPSLKQSQTLELNLNPFPKNPNPLWKILNPFWKNLNPAYPLKFFLTLLENVLTLLENLSCNHPKNLSPEYFLTPLKISHTPWKCLNPLNIS